MANETRGITIEKPEPRRACNIADCGAPAEHALRLPGHPGDWIFVLCSEHVRQLRDAAHGVL